MDGRRIGSGTVATAVAVSMVLAACGGPSTYSGDGVTFQYPHGWKTVIAPGTTPGSAGPTSRVGVGVDAANLVIMVSTHLAQPSGPQDTVKAEESVLQSLSDGAKQRGATVQGPTADHLGALDGFGLTITGLTSGGVTVGGRVIVAMNGNVEYLLNCQATADHAEEIGAGCAQVVDSFTVA